MNAVQKEGVHWEPDDRVWFRLHSDLRYVEKHFEHVHRFVDAMHVQSVNTATHMGGQQNHCAFRIYDGYKGYCYNKIGGQSRWIGDNSLQWKENDRLELRFDLKSGVCRVFLNSKELGNLADQIPDEFYLGASPYYSNDVFETTLFEVS